MLYYQIVFLITCFVDSQCNKNEPDTEYICENKETVLSYCRSIPVNILYGINLPQEGAIYNTRAIVFDIKPKKGLSSVELIGIPQPITLCRNCNVKFTKKISFNEGEHEIGVKCISYEGIQKTSIIHFFNDYTAPKIIQINPPGRSTISAGEFSVKYTENNLKEVILHYGLDEITKTDCPKGILQTCYFTVDISKYKGKQMNYKFEFIDKAGNSASSSKTTRVNVI